jgi:hypothetical protein
MQLRGYSFAVVKMDNKLSSPNRGDKMRRVAEVYAQLSSLQYRSLLSDAQRKAESAKLKKQLDELLTEVWK